MIRPPENAEHIGDGVYAWHDGYQVWVATERLIGHWCCVALEPPVLARVNQITAPLKPGEKQRLTISQRELMKAGKALVAHCPECDEEYFLGVLPMDVRELPKGNAAKCGKGHPLYVGPLRE